MLKRGESETLQHIADCLVPFQNWNVVELGMKIQIFQYGQFLVKRKDCDM